MQHVTQMPTLHPLKISHALSLHLKPASHTSLRARDHCTSSIVIGGKGGAGEVRFTLQLRDQLCMWMQDGCKVYMDSYTTLNGSCSTITWNIFRKPPFGGRLDIGRPRHSEILQSLFCCIFICARTLHE